ncbi:MAG: peptidoglycan DD-metalloendopeptidase family protein [Elusimicrobia bacterium]|nr:peptidoglycan DD-metalloendopeptidase family protein [Elusimicrobiota bacterium]MDE2426199.1 peptidoglycan DD-metalloendopeptidase family protein [Elusimicrobiota bacterium]
MPSLRILLAGACAAVLALPSSSSASWRGKRRQLAKVRKELEATRRQIEQYQNLEESLGKDFEQAQSRSGEAQRRLARLQGAVRRSERRRGRLRSQLAALGLATGYWKSSIGSELRGYELALAGREDDYGRSDLWAQAYRRAAIENKVRLLRRLRGASRTTARSEAQARLRSQSLAQQRFQADRQRQSVSRELARKQAALLAARQAAAAAVAKARELEASAQALTKLLRVLRGGNRSKARAPAAPWNVPPRSLPWPLAGSILRPFGRQRNPELGTWVINQGILLKTARAASVAAVRAGKVIFCGPFRSYGKVVIVDHGSNFFSIYGWLGDILKAKGAAVAAGEVIGTAGPPRRGRGGRLYLELRRGTDALDPLAWLRRR